MKTLVFLLLFTTNCLAQSLLPPSQGKQNQTLGVDASGLPIWTRQFPSLVLVSPSQIIPGPNGQVLGTNGTSTSWVSPTGASPLYIQYTGTLSTPLQLNTLQGGAT